MLKGGLCPMQQELRCDAAKVTAWCDHFSRTSDYSIDSLIMQLSLGTMVIGDQLSMDEGRALLNCWKDLGLIAFDTAQLYPAVHMAGKCESLLGEAGVEGVYSTKANSWTEGGLSPASVRAQLCGSLERLQIKQVDIFYLHMPDHKVPILDTLKVVDELFKEGCFRRFGLSNYAAWEVTEIIFLCQQHSFVKPSVYQGLYNVLTRSVENELLICLKRFDIQFVAYNVTVGGFIGNSGESARFTTSVHQKLYSGRYANDAYEKATTLAKSACAKHDVSPYDAAIRWLTHHSKLRKDDVLIIGASKIANLKANVESARAGPLPEDLVAALDEAAQVAKPAWTMYQRSNNEFNIA